MRKIIVVIRPQWVAKILNGEKTLEIRKTLPKEWKDYLSGKTDKKPEPVEVLIYCTKDKGKLVFDYQTDQYQVFYESDSNCEDNLNGKVVAKFTLNMVEKIKEDESCGLLWSQTMIEETLLKASCLTQEELYGYLSVSIGCDNDGWVYGYAWHIDNLVVFDKPKELSDFNKVGYIEYAEELYREYIDDGYSKCKAWGKAEFDAHIEYRLTKAPQSWCYVEV